MGEVELLVWDIGGVLLSDGWDRAQRRSACEHFGLDLSGFEQRHEEAVDDFERGRLPLEDYLRRTVGSALSDRELAEWRQFIFAQSVPVEGAISLARELSDSGGPRLVTLNDESRELNLYRIRQFRLDRMFDAFYSSCFTGLRKPSMEAFRLVLDISQRDPARVTFIDDRDENVAAAVRSGMRAIRFHDPGQLREELGRAGVLGN